LLSIILGYYLQGGVIDSEKIFSSLFILNIIKFYGLVYPGFMQIFLVQLNVISKRVCDVLLIPEIADDNLTV
jgi:hypothetical protein